MSIHWQDYDDEARWLDSLPGAEEEWEEERERRRAESEAQDEGASQ